MEAMDVEQAIVMVEDMETEVECCSDRDIVNQIVK